MNDPAITDRQALAGEYVLGTLSAEQRRALEQRLHEDEALAAAVRDWEERLLPLTALAGRETPSPHLWHRIERSLAALEPRPLPTPALTGGWWRSLLFWRGLSGVALAACLLLGLSTALLVNRPLPAPRFVVVLAAPEDRTPGWVVQAGDARRLRLIPLTRTELPADRVLQFWTKADDWSAPVSLGLVAPGQSLELALEQLPPLEPDQLFELTLEQVGGSPTGRPSGPIQFIGRAVSVF